VIALKFKNSKLFMVYYATNDQFCQQNFQRKPWIMQLLVTCIVSE